MVTLDRSLTYKYYIAKIKAIIGLRNNILKKLVHTKWGAYAGKIRFTALVLCYSTAEYIVPVWIWSSHAKKIDPVLNAFSSSITGCLKSIKVDDFDLLIGIVPTYIGRTVHSKIREELALVFYFMAVNQ